MIDSDLAAIAAARDFSTGIAVWRSENTSRQVPDFTTKARFATRPLLPFAFAGVLTVVNCALLGFTLLPATAGL